MTLATEPGNPSTVTMAYFFHIAFGLRRSRYMEISKTRLQHLSTAAAINLEPVSDWLAGISHEQTRLSAFARVMQPLTA
jgi:transposase